MTAQVRASAWVVTALPFALSGILYLLNPEYVSQLIIREDPFVLPGIVPCGWLMIGIGLLMMGKAGIGKGAQRRFGRVMIHTRQGSNNVMRPLRNRQRLCSGGFTRDQLIRGWTHLIFKEETRFLRGFIKFAHPHL